MICQSTQPGNWLDLSIVLVDAMPSVSTGQLKWQNDRTGRVSWQPADLRVTGQSLAMITWTSPPRRVSCPT